MQTIYIVEDDFNIRELLIYTLRTNGYKVEGFENAKKLYEKLEDNKPDLLILDIMLEGEDGFQILKKLRTIYSLEDLGIIMLTAKDSEFDKVKGLELGADDYVSKPFSVMELLSRVKAILRRIGPEDISKIIEYQDLYLDRDSRQVYIDNMKLDLTYKEFELLYFLMLNKGIVMTRDTIMSHVWGFDYTGETRTVDVHIRSLRQKLGKNREYIQTVRNVGYKLGG